MFCPLARLRARYVRASPPSDPGLVWRGRERRVVLREPPPRALRDPASVGAARYLEAVDGGARARGRRRRTGPARGAPARCALARRPRGLAGRPRRRSGLADAERRRSRPLRARFGPPARARAAR